MTLDFPAGTNMEEWKVKMEKVCKESMQKALDSALDEEQNKREED